MIRNNETLDYETILNLLTRISEAILDENTSDERFERIVRNISNSFNASAGSLALPDNSHLVLKTMYDGKKEETYSPDSELTVSHGDGITGRSYEDREIFEVKNLSDWSDFEEKPPPTIDWNSLDTAVAIPLIVQSECVGVITLFFSQSIEIEKSEEALLRAVAKQSGIVIRHGRKLEELERLNKRLRIEADTDELTGLPNQGKIMNILKNEIERTNRYQRPLALLMLDVDRFKSVNDTYGHPVGDDVLEELAAEFKHQVRQSDQVGRYGGEEFMFVLPETEEEEAVNLAERIRSEVESMTIQSNGHEISTTVSEGIAGRQQKSEVSAEELLNKADEALLSAKNRGRNQCVLYSELKSNS